LEKRSGRDYPYYFVSINLTKFNVKVDNFIDNQFISSPQVEIKFFKDPDDNAGNKYLFCLEEDISGTSINNWVRKARSQKSHNFFFSRPILTWPYYPCY
jgi:hypothetical protein